MKKRVLKKKRTESDSDHASIYGYECSILGPEDMEWLETELQVPADWDATID